MNGPPPEAPPPETSPPAAPLSTGHAATSMPARRADDFRIGPWSPKFGAITIDLDSLYCYARIFGADETEAAFAANTVYERALPRFLELCDAVDAKATLFAVARDLDIPTDTGPSNGQRLAAAARAGHEIGNHSLTHPYDLIHRSSSEILHEVEEARRRLEAATGTAVRGFRAPGYNVSPALFQAVKASGHVYDASHFPCWPYHLAKAAVVTLLRLLGRPSRSVLSPWRVLTVPTGPHSAALADPFRPARDDEPKLWEMPISTLPLLGLPALGSYLALQGTLGAPIFSALLQFRDFHHYEFHGMDFLDATDGLPPALAAQPDTRIPVARKMDAYRAVLKRSAAQRTFQPLIAVASLYGCASARHAPYGPFSVVKNDPALGSPPPSAEPVPSSASPSAPPGGSIP